MNSICVNTIVRNADDVIDFCLPTIIPFVDRVIITLDSRSDDGTKEKLRELYDKYSNLELSIFNIRDPVRDIVNMRNYQLEKVKEDWLWIVDSDEYYQKNVVENIKWELISSDAKVIGLKCIAPWDEKRGH